MTFDTQVDFVEVGDRSLTQYQPNMRN